MNYYLIVIVCMLSSALFAAEGRPMTQLAPEGTVRPSPFQVLPEDIKGIITQKIIYEHPTLIEPTYTILLGEIQWFKCSDTSDGNMALTGSITLTEFWHICGT